MRRLNINAKNLANTKEFMKYESSKTERKLNCGSWQHTHKLQRQQHEARDNNPNASRNITSTVQTNIRTLEQ